MKSYRVAGEWTGSRADRFIRALFPDIPFPSIQMLFRKGRILLGGKRVSGNVRLEEGDIIEIHITEGKGAAGKSNDLIEVTGSLRIEKRTGGPASRKRRIQTAGMEIGENIRILYEDDEILVLNKPAGLVVHPGNERTRGSLLDLLERYRSVKEKCPRREPTFPYSPVHRLDRETTGTLVIAKTRSAARELSRAFKAGLVEKSYLAVVEGIPSTGEGKISEPIKVEKGRRSLARAGAGGKKALSSYSILKKIPGPRALLEVRIRTGRTHQIRSHLASIGHPVAGDRIYGSGKSGKGGKMLLHAWRITLPHPKDGRRIEVTAPPRAGMPEITP